MSLETDERIVSNDEPLAVVKLGDANDVTVYADELLAGRLNAAGFTVTDDLAAATIAVVRSIDDDVSSFVKCGNGAVMVPGEDGRMTDEDVYCNLSAAESWNRVTLLLYQDSNPISDLCSDACVGWAFEDLFQYNLVDNPEHGGEVHVGFVEGWLANWGSPLVVVNRGDGRLCRCTFRVTDPYGDHPTALLTQIIDHLD